MKTQFGYTPLLWSVEAKGWTEAYGYLGSYYTTYERARWEINFLMYQFPEKYQHWKIERIELDAHKFVVGESVTIAQSKEAA